MMKKGSLLAKVFFINFKHYLLNSKIYSLVRTNNFIEHYTANIYMYIYIVINEQIVSLYHNSSMGLDTQDASSWD